MMTELAALKANIQELAEQMVEIRKAIHQIDHDRFKVEIGD